ncbi:hypothetical protein [Brevibacillus sp. NRS-1366]|uniref:hypothetical protein n=1 Tax=Brevibacillus sp. NRS-1366 TaxID=3233899 RepID=UPI003D1C28B9
MKTVEITLSSRSSEYIQTLQGVVSLPKVKKIIEVKVSPSIAEKYIETKLDTTNDKLYVTLHNVRHSWKNTSHYKFVHVDNWEHQTVCWYNSTGNPNETPYTAWLYLEPGATCPAGRTIEYYEFDYRVTVFYEDNTVPTLDLLTNDSQKLTDGKLFKIYGTANDVDSGDKVTIKYKINNLQERVILTGESNSASPIPFTKVLSIRDGRLFDGSSSASSQLVEGVTHTLSVWAEDNNGGKSSVATRTFTMTFPIVDKTPKPSTYTGSIPASIDLIKAMRSAIKQTFIKLEFYDSKMNYINEFSKAVTTDDIGSISVDINRPVRRTFSFSLDNRKSVFNWGEEKLIWIDKRVKVYLGLKLPNGTIEYVPQGVFIISEPQDSHTLEGKRTFVSGQDKMWLMTDKRGKFLYDTKIEEGLNVGTALKIIASKAGETLFNFDEIDEVVPYELSYSPSDNLYKALEELSSFAKGIIYYDVFGYLRFKKIDLNSFEHSPASWVYKFNGTDERFYAGNTRKLDESNLANHITVLGGSGQTAISSYEIIVDDNDPLWKDHPYSIQKIGRITYSHNNGSPDSLLTTKEECKWRAKYELMKRLGYAERLSLNAAPVFVHDAGEIIEIDDEENDVKGKYLLETFSLPIKPALMTSECVKYRKVIDNWGFI